MILALKRWGYTRKEAASIRVLDVDPIYQEAQFREAFALAQEKGALSPFETIHQRKDGTRFPVEVSRGRPRVPAGMMTKPITPLVKSCYSGVIHAFVLLSQAAFPVIICRTKCAFPLL